MADPEKAEQSAETNPTPATSQTIDWFHEGQARTVVVDGVEVTVRLVGRKGRRVRIAISAPGGAVVRSIDADSC